MQNDNEQEDFLYFFAKGVAKHLSKLISEPGQKEVSKPAEEEYFNTEQAKEYLGIKSTGTLKSYVTKGFIPEPTRAGGRNLRYKKSDLSKFLEYGI